MELQYQKKLSPMIRAEIIGGRVVKIDPSLNNRPIPDIILAQIERAKEFFKLHGEPDFHKLYPEHFPKNDK